MLLSFLFLVFFLPFFFHSSSLQYRLSNSHLLLPPAAKWPHNPDCRIFLFFFSFYIPFHSFFFCCCALYSLNIKREPLIYSATHLPSIAIAPWIIYIQYSVHSVLATLSQLSHSQLICRASSDQSLVRHHQEPPKNQKIKKSKKPTCTSGSCSRPDQLLSSYPILFSLSLFFFFFSPLWSLSSLSLCYTSASLLHRLYSTLSYKGVHSRIVILSSHSPTPTATSTITITTTPPPFFPPFLPPSQSHIHAIHGHNEEPFWYVRGR